MKKYITVAALLIAGTAFANAATTLTYWAGNTGNNLLTVENGSMPYLGNTGATACVGSDVIANLTTVGDTTYSLNFKDTAEAVYFAVNDALYFYQIWSDGSIGKYTIDFGENGSITAAEDSDKWGGAIRFTQNATVTFNVAVAESTLSSLTEGSLYTRVLMVTPESSGNGVNGMWNVTDHLTVNLTGIEGYENVGTVTDTSTLKKGQYGFVVAGGDSVSLVVAAIPEPSLFGLFAGLGALCLVGTRRRRR